MLGDEIVERGEQVWVWPIRTDDEGRDRACDILLGNVDRDVARVGGGMAGGDDQPARMRGIGRAEGVGIARNAGIDFAVRRIHGELIDRSMRHIRLRRHIRRAGMRGAKDEVAVGCRRGKGAVRQLCGMDVTGRVGIARGRRGMCCRLRRRSYGLRDGRACCGQKADRECEAEKARQR